MPLSCSCNEWDGDGIGWEVPTDFTRLQTKKRTRCKSCKTLINIGSEVLEFKRFHYPQNDIEEKIWGDASEIHNAPWYLCNHCGEIFTNLDDLKFCVRPDENMDELLAEYRHEFIKDNGLYQGGTDALA